MPDIAQFMEPSVPQFDWIVGIKILAMVCFAAGMVFLVWYWFRGGKPKQKNIVYG